MIITNTSQLSRQSWLEHPHYEIFRNKSVVTADGGGGQPIGFHGINAFAYTILEIGHLLSSLTHRKLSATAIVTVGTTENRMRHLKPQNSYHCNLFSESSDAAASFLSLNILRCPSRIGIETIFSPMRTAPALSPQRILSLIRRTSG